jgi:hypothetical protein
MGMLTETEERTERLEMIAYKLIREQEDMRAQLGALIDTLIPLVKVGEELSMLLKGIKGIRPRQSE